MFLPQNIVSANRANLLVSIGKLAIAGERAGFTIEEMIGFLDAGMTVKALVDIITERLDLNQSDSAPKEYRV